MRNTCGLTVMFLQALAERAENRMRPRWTELKREKRWWLHFFTQDMKNVEVGGTMWLVLLTKWAVASPPPWRWSQFSSYRATVGSVLTYCIAVCRVINSSEDPGLLPAPPWRPISPQPPPLSPVALWQRLQGARTQNQQTETALSSEPSALSTQTRWDMNKQTRAKSTILVQISE